MSVEEEEGSLELRLNNHILNTNNRFGLHDRRLKDHDTLHAQTNGTVIAQGKLIEATQKQVDAQLEGTEVLREVAILLKDFTEAMKPVIKGLAWIGRAVKYVGFVAGGAYACWVAGKYAVVAFLHWAKII